MAKKHARNPAAVAAAAPRRRRGGLTASKVFIAVIVLFAAIIGIASALGDGPPVDCPAGQVWSDDHGHCH